MQIIGSADRARKRLRRNGPLHEAMLTSATGIDWRATSAQLLVLVWARKLRAAGHRVTARRREYLKQVAECVLRGDDPTLLTLSSRRPVELRIEAADVDAVMALVDEIMQKATRGVVAKAGREAADLVLKGALPMAMQVRAEAEAFERRLRKPWGRAFDYMRAFISLCIEAGDRHLEHAQTRRGTRAEALTLAQLHARGCVIASEVLVLLESGHASGALARWRTLHEVDVVAAFIADKGSETARRYRAHADAEHLKIERAAELDPETLDVRELLGPRRARRLLRWGRSFGTDFGWAAPSLGLKRATLSDLEEVTGREG